MSKWFSSGPEYCVGIIITDHETIAFTCYVDGFMAVVEGGKKKCDKKWQMRKIFSDCVDMLFDYNVSSLSQQNL